MNPVVTTALASSALTLLSAASVVCAQPWEALPEGSPFSFRANELEPIQYSRVPDEGAVEPARHLPLLEPIDWSTSLSFKLRPSLPDFSRAGAYGLGMFGTPELSVHSNPMLPGALPARAPDLQSGFSYSAGVRVEHEKADISGTAYVSSSLLGLSYGRLGRVWYSGVDVNLEQFDSDEGTLDRADILSLDFTTGRRLNFTGRSATDPLWLLSLQGNFDMQALEDEETEDSSDWFLNPSLFWQHPGFTFSAQMQLPMETTSTDATHEPDYRLRAVFQKRF